MKPALALALAGLLGLLSTSFTGFSQDRFGVTRWAGSYRTPITAAVLTALQWIDDQIR